MSYYANRLGKYGKELAEAVADHMAMYGYEGDDGPVRHRLYVPIRKEKPKEEKDEQKRD